MNLLVSKCFQFSLNHHINRNMSCSYLFSFKGNTRAKSTTEVQYLNIFLEVQFVKIKFVLSMVRNES